MFELRVISFCGTPTAAGLRLAIDTQREATVGRSAECDLVLPDADRHISRIQVRVASNIQGRVTLTNASTVNSVFVNTAEIQPAQTAQLQLGDKVTVGLYGLELCRGEVQAQPATQAGPADRAQPADPGARAPDAWDLTAQAFAAPTRERDAPMAEPARPVARQQAARPPADLLPHDFDPFQMAPPGPRAGVPSAADPLSIGTFSADVTLKDMFESSVSIDGMFGDKPVHAADAALPGATPELAMSLADEPGTDPLALFGPATDVQPDAGPVSSRMSAAMAGRAGELDALFDLPRGRAEAAPRSGLVAGGHADHTMVPAGPALPDIFADLDGGPPALPVALDTPLPAAAAPPPPMERKAEAPPPASRPAAIAGQDHGADTLLDALLEGAGVPELSVPDGLTPGYMRYLGRLLRNATSGIVDLALVRKATKKEIQSDITILSSTANNPFKFAPDGASLLPHVLGKPFPGFMPSDEAVGQIFDDLRDHEMALLAAVRSTLLELLERVSPETIERKGAGQGGLLQSALPMAHKARMWEAYRETFDQLQGGAQGDPATIFADVFKSHYEREFKGLHTETGLSGRA